MSQRAYLYGLPLAMLMITLLVAAARRRSTRWFVVAGVVGGLLPLAHLPTLLAMAMTVPFLALLLASRPWRDPLHRIPWTGWIVFGLVLGRADPQLLHGWRRWRGCWSAFSVSSTGCAADEWWWFWAEDRRPGTAQPRPSAACQPPDARRRGSRRVLLAACMVIFVVANLAVVPALGLGRPQGRSSTGSSRLAFIAVGGPARRGSWRRDRRNAVRSGDCSSVAVATMVALAAAREPRPCSIGPRVATRSSRGRAGGDGGAAARRDRAGRPGGRRHAEPRPGDDAERPPGADGLLGPVATDRWRVYDVRSLTASAAP